jgi:hypothetical protein
VQWGNHGFKNQSIFVKIDKTGLVWFCRLTENQRVEFEIFKKLKNFEIKIPKKTSIHFKNFDQNRI